MAEVEMRGSRTNLAGLLRCMADEIEAGEDRSSTAFSQFPGDDPSHSLRLVVDEGLPRDTILRVWR